MRKEDNSQQWEQLVSDYRNSGMTAKAWCEAKKIKMNTLKYWIAKLKVNDKKVDSNIKWATVPFSGHPSTPSPITLKISDFKIEIEQGFDKAVLAELLSVVMKLC
jgi:orotate phosphoribosyltransferase-like protein